MPKDLSEKLKSFEASFSYPFSDQERFRIEHGVAGDYFAFFKQLGKVRYYVATCKKDETVTKMVNGQRTTFKRKAGEIAAVGCGILRTLKTTDGKPIKAWYICDLKVGEHYQGEHLPTMLIQRGAWRFFQSPRGFGICMNPPNKKPKAAEIWRNHGPISGSNTQTLNLYTLSSEEVKKKSKDIDAILRKHGYMKDGEHLAFKSTSGAKDYQIFGANAKETHSWQLLHIQPGTTGKSEPQKDHTHMITSLVGTPLDDSFKKILGDPSSTAQVVSYGMEKIDFNLITSNQI